MAQANKGSFVRDNQSCTLETNESNKKANTNANGHAQILRHGIDDCLTDMTDRQQQEKDA